MESELELRRRLWAELEAQNGGEQLTPGELRESGRSRRGSRDMGDKERTRHLTPDGIGVTVGLLHTGRHYADDLSEDGLLYHYPKTNRGPGRDQSEVESTKWANRLALPIFVVLPFHEPAR